MFKGLCSIFQDVLASVVKVGCLAASMGFSRVLYNLVGFQRPENYAYLISNIEENLSRNLFCLWELCLCSVSWVGISLSRSGLNSEFSFNLIGDTPRLESPVCPTIYS